MADILAPEEYRDIELIAEELIKACARKNVIFTGFLFADNPPFIMHVGTIWQTGPELTALHLSLCDRVDTDKVKRREIKK